MVSVGEITMQNPGPGIPWTDSGWVAGEGRLSLGWNSTAVVLKVGTETSSIAWNMLGMQVLRPSQGLLNENLGVGLSPTLSGCHSTLEFENTAGEDELKDLPRIMLAHKCRAAHGLMCTSPVHRDMGRRPGRPISAGPCDHSRVFFAEEAVNEVKRQAMSELQKAVSDAERKAHELISTERAKMERALAEARRQASEDALTVINQQEDSSEVGAHPTSGS